MYFDAHTHTHFAAFSEDYKEVIKRALDAGVGMINVGTQRDTSKRGIEVAHEFESSPVYATVGLHPVHTEKSYHDIKELGTDDKAKEFTSRGEEFDFEYYKKLAEDPKVVGIGECGLDYYRLNESTKKKQEEVFIGHIKVAHAVGKPLMIHCRSGEAKQISPRDDEERNAFTDLIKILKAHSSKLTATSGVIHFFAGSVRDAEQLIDLGFSFTFGGAITFPPKKGKRAGDYDEVIQSIPMDRILSETDAPYVTPVPYRGKRNEPTYVVEVVKKLAELKGVSAEEMQAQIWTNAKRVWAI